MAVEKLKINYNIQI